MNFLLVGTIAVATGIVHLLDMYYAKKNGIELSGNILPRFMMISSYSPNEKLLYSSTVIGITFVLCIIGLVKFSQEDVNKKIFEISESGAEYVYCRLVLVGWDNSVLSSRQVTDMQRSITGLGLEHLAVTVSQGLSKKRTRLDTLKLYIRRVIGFFGYAAMQGACYLFIAFLTVNSRSIQSRANSVGNELVVIF
jgi:hypothetical protein